MVPRRFKVVAALISAVALAYLLLPRFVENRVRSALVTRGFPDAELDVTSVGIDHVHMRNVHLEPGVDIGAVDLDRGISLLWNDVERVSVRDARVDTTAIDDLVRKFRTRKASAAPAKPVRIDVELSVREPTAHGLRIEARGSLVLDRDVRLEAGHVDVTLPRRSLGAATIEHAELSADVAGNVSTADLRARGTARGGLLVGRLAITEVTAPFTFDREGLRVTGARAKAAGGELAVAPVLVGRGPVTVTMRARGLSLATLLAPTNKVTGAGRVDGDLTLRLDNDDVSLTSASLRGQPGGRLQVSDAQWRDQVAKMQSPLAVHAAIASAMTDFDYRELAVELGPRHANPELRLTTRGRGHRNHQELDIAINIRGVRDALPSLLGGSP